MLGNDDATTNFSDSSYLFAVWSCISLWICNVNITDLRQSRIPNPTPSASIGLCLSLHRAPVVYALSGKNINKSNRKLRALECRSFVFLSPHTLLATVSQMRLKLRYMHLIYATRCTRD